MSYSRAATAKKSDRKAYVIKHAQSNVFLLDPLLAEFFDFAKC